MESILREKSQATSPEDLRLPEVSYITGASRLADGGWAA
jgi:hypothetical protein